MKVLKILFSLTLYIHNRVSRHDKGFLWFWLLFTTNDCAVLINLCLSKVVVEGAYPCPFPPGPRFLDTTPL